MSAPAEVKGTNVLEKVFDLPGDFAAYHAAERWCSQRGISVGRMQARAPTGLLVGEFDIAKWRNLNATERAALDGTLTGDFRNGPVVLRIRRAALASLKGRSHG